MLDYANAGPPYLTSAYLLTKILLWCKLAMSTEEGSWLLQDSLITSQLSMMLVQ